METMSWTDDRLDEFAAQTERRFDRLEQRMDARFDKVDQRFERIEERFERIDERFDSLHHMMLQFGFAGIVTMAVGLAGLIVAILVQA
jgi:predicted nuclease with TOPRIM domain